MTKNSTKRQPMFQKPDTHPLFHLFLSNQTAHRKREREREREREEEANIPSNVGAVRWGYSWCYQYRRAQKKFPWRRRRRRSLQTGCLRPPNLAAGTASPWNDSFFVLRLHCRRRDDTVNVKICSLKDLKRKRHRFIPPSLLKNPDFLSETSERTDSRVFLSTLGPPGHINYIHMLKSENNKKR